MLSSRRIENNDCFAVDKHFPAGDNDKRKWTFCNIKLWKTEHLQQRNGKSIQLYKH